MKLHPILTRYMSPAGDGTDAGGGGDAGDRGDDFTPTGDDAKADKDAPSGKDAADKIVKDAKDAGKNADEETDEEKAAKAKAGKDAEDDDDKDEKGEKRKDTRIPVSRHKELLEKERLARTEVEKKLARYEQGDRVAVINDEITKAEEKVTALDAEYAALITDGKHSDAAAKMKEIRKLEREIGDKKANLSAAEATSRAIETVRYQTTVERLEEAYPVLNPDHEDFDQEQAVDVRDLAATYTQHKGMTPAEAIQKAAIKLLGSTTKKQEDATTVKARVDKEEADAVARAEARKKKQVEKNLETSGKQPPDTSKLGADHDKAGGGIEAKDVLRMSHDDFVKLDEATLARMRGDALA
jgi:hypothetical protein